MLIIVIKSNYASVGNTSMLIIIALVSSSSQLLTVYPENNSLALVYRDKETLKFVKHVNHRSSSDSGNSSTCRALYDFSFVYYE